MSDWKMGFAPIAGSPPPILVVVVIHTFSFFSLWFRYQISVTFMPMWAIVALWRAYVCRSKWTIRYVGRQLSNMISQFKWKNVNNFQFSSFFVRNERLCCSPKWEWSQYPFEGRALMIWLRWMKHMRLIFGGIAGAMLSTWQWFESCGFWFRSHPRWQATSHTTEANVIMTWAIKVSSTPQTDRSRSTGHSTKSLFSTKK